MMSMNMSSCQSFELAPAPMSISTANVSGWLMKRKKHEVAADSRWQQQAWQRACTAILGSFNRRFFWMDFNIHLVYYAESPQAKRVAFIPFSGLRAVTPITSPVKINAAREGWVWGISLRTVNRSLDLWAQSEAEQLMWLDALNKAIGQDIPLNMSALNSSVALTQSAVLGMASSRQPVQSSAFPTPQMTTPQLTTPQMPTTENIENRWAENSVGNSGSLAPSGLPPIKERATWEAMSDDGNIVPAKIQTSGNLPSTMNPVISASRKWDDWDN